MKLVVSLLVQRSKDRVCCLNGLPAPAGTEMSLACLTFKFGPTPLNRFNLGQVLVFPEPLQEEKNDSNKYTISLPYRWEGISAKNARCAWWPLYLAAQMLHTMHIAYLLG